MPRPLGGVVYFELPVNLGVKRRDTGPAFFSSRLRPISLRGKPDKHDKEYMRIGVSGQLLNPV